MRKILGITQRMTVVEKTGEKRDCLAQDWYRFFTALDVGWTALPNRPSDAVRMVEEMNVGGVILSGGDDIGVFPERDETEAALLAWCRDTKRPLIGVCRGFQMLHHWLGGQMIRVDPELHVASRHGIRDNSGAERIVNSYHNFTPDFSALPETYPLQVQYTCSRDATVEAAGNDIFFGTMWHPEREAIPERDDIVFFKKHFDL